MRPIKTFDVFLILILLLGLFGCNQPESVSSEQQNSAFPICTVCPKFNGDTDTLTYIIEVMDFVAENADAGLLESQKVKDELSVGFENIDVDRVIELFQHDSGTVICGEVATIMTKALVDNGITAYTFSFGFEDVGLSHEVVLARANGLFYILDPIQNYILLDEQGKPIDILTVINQIGNNILSVKASTDTVMAEIIIDQRMLASLNLPTSYSQDSECTRYWSEVEFIADSIVKRKFTRCFACEIDRPCEQDNFRTRFEIVLKERTLLHQYHEGLVINAQVLAGSSDAQMVDDMIQTAIYSQPDLGKRINTRSE
ncbi:MAG: hypothetical protein RL266_2727 [Bacteroidota bacterium]|jgi:hypothetical protein